MILEIVYGLIVLLAAAFTVLLVAFAIVVAFGADLITEYDSTISERVSGFDRDDLGVSPEPAESPATRSSTP